jgi:hypothetical protein
VAPSLDDLREFFHHVSQGEERATTISFGALSPSHRLLAKIIQHNLWPTVRRSNFDPEEGSVLVCHRSETAFLLVQAYS